MAEPPTPPRAGRPRGRLPCCSDRTLALAPAPGPPGPPGPRPPPSWGGPLEPLPCFKGDAAGVGRPRGPQGRRRGPRTPRRAALRAGLGALLLGLLLVVLGLPGRAGAQAPAAACEALSGAAGVAEVAAGAGAGGAPGGGGLPELVVGVLNVGVGARGEGPEATGEVCAAAALWLHLLRSRQGGPVAPVRFAAVDVGVLAAGRLNVTATGQATYAAGVRLVEGYGVELRA